MSKAVGFDKLNQRFDKLNQRFDKLNQRFDKLNQQLPHIIVVEKYRQYGG